MIDYDADTSNRGFYNAVIRMGGRDVIFSGNMPIQDMMLLTGQDKEEM